MVESLTHAMNKTFHNGSNCKIRQKLSLLLTVGGEGFETKRIRRLFDKNSYGYYIKNIVCQKFGIEEYFFLTRLLQAYLIQF